MRSDRTAEQLQGWLRALARVGSAVNQGVSLDELLNMVARTACELMDYDFSSVTLPDKHSEVLVIEGSYGLSDEYIRYVNATHPVHLHGASPPAPSTQAFTLGIPIQIEDTGTNPAYGPWAGVGHNQGIGSMLAVPLNSASETLGTLNCYKRFSHHFSKDEESLLTVLAHQAAIAITTARLRAEQSSAIARLNSLNETLEEQYELQRQVAEVHDRLTSLALEGGGIDEVGAALAELLGRTVIIRHRNDTLICGSEFSEDDLVEVLSEEASRQNRSVSHSEVRNRGLSDIVFSSRAGKFVTAVQAPVVIKEDVVAWIWTTGSVAELAPMNLRAIEHAATVMALELLSAQTAIEAAWRHSGEIVSGVLSGLGKESSSLVAEAATLGHDLSQPHAVIVTRADWMHDGAPQFGLFDALDHLTGESHPEPLVGMHQSYIVVLWPLGSAPLESARHVSDEIRRTLAGGVSGQNSTLAVVTGPVTDPDGYPEAFSTARGAAELAGLRGMAGRTLLLTDLEIAGLLLQVPDSSKLQSYCEEVLGPLRQHDTSHGAGLIQTLSALVRNNLDVRATADQLLVDRDTIVQRRRLIEELLGLELSNVTALTRVATALQLEDVIAARWQ